MRPNYKSILETGGDTAIVRFAEISSALHRAPDEIPLEFVRHCRELISRSHELRTLAQSAKVLWLTLYDERAMSVSTSLASRRPIASLL